MKMGLLFHLFVVLVCICFACGQSGDPIVDCEDNLSCPVPRGEMPGPPVCLSRSQLCDTMSDCSGGEDETLFICSETSMFQCDDEADGDGLVVTIDAVCDGNKDCNDTGRDELNILCNKCLMPYYGNCSYTRECIPKELFSTVQTACGDCLPGYHDDSGNPDPTGECLADVVEIGLESLSNIFPEDVGAVEVCIVLSGSDINISSISIHVSVVPGTAEDDDYTYSPPNGSDGSSTLTFTSSTLRQCIRVDVTDDCVVEETEIIFVTISPVGDLPDAVALINSNVSLFIEDNDGGNVTVYFEEAMYTVVEGVDIDVEVCIVIEGECCTNVTVTLFTADGTATGTVQPDYGFENENLVFDHDDAKQCIRIPIIDDDQVEDLEMFFVNLTTSDAGIETSQEARIYIDDPTDMLVIGFEMERFTADESQSVEVCVTIHDGGLETQVSVTLVTDTVELQMHFTHQNRRECEFISATSSAQEFVEARLSTTDPRVSLEPSIANITWQGNDDENEPNDDEETDPTANTSSNNNNNEDSQTPKSGDFLSNGGSIFGVTFGIVTFIAGVLTVYIFLRKTLCRTKKSNDITSEGGSHSVATRKGLIATNRNIAYNGTAWAAKCTAFQRPHASAWDRDNEVFVVKSLAVPAEPGYTTVISNTTSGGYEHNNPLYEKLADFQTTCSQETTPPTCDYETSENLMLEAEEFCSNSSASNDKTNDKSSCVTSNNKSMRKPGSDSDSTAVGRSSGIPAIEHADHMQRSELQAVDATTNCEDYESVGQVYEHSVENYGYESMGSVYDQSSRQNGYESLGSIYDRQYSTYETLGSVYEPISLADAKSF